MKFLLQGFGFYKFKEFYPGNEWTGPVCRWFFGSYSVIWDEWLVLRDK
jgi:hypothetical protein